MTTTHATAPADALVLYTTSWCPYCRSLTTALRGYDVPFTEIDVEADPEAAAFVEGVNGGDRIVPTVRYPDGTTATNPAAIDVRRRVAAS